MKKILKGFFALIVLFAATAGAGLVIGDGDSRIGRLQLSLPKACGWFGVAALVSGLSAKEQRIARETGDLQ